MIVPKHPRRHGIMMMVTLLLSSAAACGGEAKETQAVDGSNASPVAATTGNAPNTAGTAGADDRPVRTTTESDTLFLEMADGGCKSHDFRSFFWAYSGSWAVREKYTAETITVGMAGQSRPKPRRGYLDQNDFPIAPMDYEFVTAESAGLFESKRNASWRDLSYVQLEFNTASDNRQRVDWLPGIFQKHLTPPPPELEEGLGDMVRKTGGGGTLLFSPTKTCWELTQDVQNPMPQP